MTDENQPAGQAETTAVVEVPLYLLDEFTDWLAGKGWRLVPSQFFTEYNHSYYAERRSDWLRPDTELGPRGFANTD